MLSLSRRLFDDFPSFNWKTDRFFDDSLSQDIWMLPKFKGFEPEIEAFERDDKSFYRIALAGVDPGDVDLSFIDGKLLVKVERKAPDNVQDGDWQVKGLSYGLYEQVLLLPKGTDPEKIDASFNQGILEIIAPMAQADLPKKIEVKSLASINTPELKANS